MNVWTHLVELVNCLVNHFWSLSLVTEYKICRMLFVKKFALVPCPGAKEIPIASNLRIQTEIKISKHTQTKKRQLLYNWLLLLTLLFFHFFLENETLHFQSTAFVIIYYSFGIVLESIINFGTSSFFFFSSLHTHCHRTQIILIIIMGRCARWAHINLYYLIVERCHHSHHQWDKKKIIHNLPAIEKSCDFSDPFIARALLLYYSIFGVFFSVAVVRFPFALARSIAIRSLLPFAYSMHIHMHTNHTAASSSLCDYYYYCSQSDCWNEN